MKRNLLYSLLMLFVVSFSSNAQVSMTGPGASGAWGVDVNLSSTDGVIWTLDNFIMPGGEFKFRLDGQWTTNWGATTFPSGTGTQDGPNIPAIAGTYNITFNQSTGEYNFTGGAPIPVVKLVGTAVTSVDGLLLATADAENYYINNATLVDGTAQFDVDATIYGGDTFPGGVVSDASLFIPVVGGDYSSVTLNIATGEYTFTAAPIFQIISITGSGATGWGNDTYLNTTDGINYTLSGLTLSSGEIKFRQGSDWAVNWGDSAWPTGVATQGGPNIPCVAGTYSVTFNRETGEYNFFFPIVSLTGSATGGWGDGFDFNLATTDGVLYSMTNFTLGVGECKFREGNSWTVNWGGADWPAGVATLSGPNIPSVPGTYDIDFNKVTGDYFFSPSLSSVSFNNGNFKVYPNPSQNVWNIASANEAITSIQIMDVLGKTVMTVAPQATSAVVDASALNSGIYFARIATASATSTVKVVKN
ncbi:MAG: T9SS type A sorting domain-containing protein [Flavobacterium sp.]|nr:T9SS type A sorting domain-containing protein [Flavobacterium sp.]